MIYKIFFLALFILTCFQSVEAQTVFQTTIIDNASKRPVYGATCIILEHKNKKMLNYSRSNSFGQVKLNLDSGIDSLTLWVLHPKYVEYKSTILSNQFPDKIILIPQSRVLREVIVKTNKAVTMNGDTVTYVADSFKLPPGATTEDLLRKLPGIQVAKDGTIKAQGKKVEKVLVDGDDFFGEDASVATRNLEASMIDKVEVIDAATRKSETTGSDEDKMKIINLKLKDAAKKGFFGKIEQGYSNTDRYNSTQMVNLFQGNTKMAGFLVADNMRSRMNWQDMQDMGMQQNWTYDEDLDVWLDNNGDGMNFNSYSVIPKNIKAGSILTQKFSDGTGAIKAKYNYNESVFDGEFANKSSMFFNNRVQSSSTNSYINSKLNKHAIGVSFEKAIDSLQKIYVNASGNIGHFNELLSSSSMTELDSTIAYRMRQGSPSVNKKESYSISADYERKFHKKGRTLGLKAEYSASTADGEKINETNGWTYRNPQDSTVIIQDQKTTNYQSGNNVKLSANFVEPLFVKGFYAESGMSYVLTKNNSFYNTFQKMSNSSDYDLKINSLSNNYRYNVGAWSEQLKLNYKSKKIEWFVGAKFHQVAMTQDNLDSGDVAILRNFEYILPHAKFTWKYKRNSNFSLSFHKSINPPDLNNLQPFTNNSNPQYVITGNPNLTPAENYIYKISNSFWYPVSQTNLWCSITYKSLKNDFADSTMISETGNTHKYFTQVDGNRSINLNIWYGFTLKKLGIEVNPGFYANLERKSNYFNSQKMSTDNLWSNFNISLEKDIDSLLESRLEVGLQWNQSRSDNPNFQNTDNLSWRIESTEELTLPWNMKLKGELEYNIYPSNAAFAQNQSFALLNASLEKRFLKDNSLIARLSVYDILGQNQSVNRSLYRNTISESNYQILTRYVMLTMTYKFKNKTKTANNEPVLD